MSTTVELKPGEVNTIIVEVTADSGAMKTYVLTVRNNGDPALQWPDEGDATKSPYGTEVYYAGDNAVINLTAAEPVWGERTINGTPAMWMVETHLCFLKKPQAH